MLNFAYDAWSSHGPSGGGRPTGNYTSGNDYGSVADKFYTVRALKYIINADESVVLDTEDAIRHEYGHTQQLAQPGAVKYLFCIVIPSFFEWGSDPVYYRRPWEITADIYGGVQSRSYPGYADAGFEYLENSRSIGIGAWLTIR